MAYDDALAIISPDGRELARASVFEAMTGQLRTPEGLSGPHRLVHIARGATGERQLASVALDIGARGATVDAGGVSGPPVISVAPKVLAGSRVAVSVRSPKSRSSGSSGPARERTEFWRPRSISGPTCRRPPSTRRARPGSG
tara:strand:+ start:6394 stop:6819 length:426 start_codon:yes stop_codon:yes gene_type:complete